MSYPNMSTIMKRLEAATSRLEDLANYFEHDKPADQSRAPSIQLTPADVPASSQISPRTQSTDETTTQPPSNKNKYPGLDHLNAKLDQLVSLSKEIDPELYAQVNAFKTASDNANNIAILAGNVIRPEVGPEFAELFKPVNTQIEQISKIREANRTSKFANHFSTVAEGSLVLGWVSCPGPSDYVKDLKEAAQFYANKVLKDFKEDPTHKEWVKTFLSFCNDLAKALDEELPEGVEWNPKGITLAQALKDTASKATASSVAPAAPAAAPSPSAGGPPPPPPPSSAELMADKPSSPASSGPSMDALFADINKGTDIHANLKHIDRKNLPKPSGPKPKPPKPSAAKAPSPAPVSTSAPVKAPSTTLIENKWLVENYTDNHEIVIELEMKQTVFIENCQRCTIVVKNKGTGVTLNNCKKVGIMVDTLISGLDFLGCTDCQAQTNGRLASLNLDKSNNLQIYLNEESLEVDIRTINTWSINLEIPTGEPGDYEEVPIAEQISHTIDPKTKKVKSVAVAPGQ